MSAVSNAIHPPSELPATRAQSIASSSIAAQTARASASTPGVIPGAKGGIP